MFAGWPRIPAAAPPAPSSDVRVHVSDGYLARVIEQRVSALGAVTLQNVSVASSPPRLLLVRGDAGVAGLTVPAELELEPIAANGAVQADIIQVQVAGLPVPGVLSDLVSGSINDSLRRAIPHNARVTGVVVTQGGVDLSADFG